MVMEGMFRSYGTPGSMDGLMGILGERDSVSPASSATRREGGRGVRPNLSTGCINFSEEEKEEEEAKSESRRGKKTMRCLVRLQPQDPVSCKEYTDRDILSTGVNYLIRNEFHPAGARDDFNSGEPFCILASSRFTIYLCLKIIYIVY